MNPRLPPAHPVPALGDLLWPREHAESRALLLKDPAMTLSYNARGALFEIGHELLTEGRDEVLLPGFHCPSGITPLLQAGLRPIFYRVRPDLRMDQEDLLAKVGPRTRAVLAIHYFGFRTDLAALQALRDGGIALIEDWSHSFLRCAPLGLPDWQGDYQVFSFWKLAACGVGGGLRRRRPGAGWTRKDAPRRVELQRFKREFEEALAHSPHRRGQAAFQAFERWRLRGRRARVAEASPGVPIRGEDHYPLDLQLARAAMPAAVRHRLLASDLAQLAAQRRAHYAQLAEGLVPHAQCLPLQPTLDAGTCPWVFPLRLQARDHIDRGWRSQGVALHTFGLWLHSALAQADVATRRDAEQLARELLCLSVHQGLHAHDLARTVQIINRHFGSA
jgi:perosamine synthetase